MILYDQEDRLIQNLNLNYRNRSRIYLWPAAKLLDNYNLIASQEIVGLGCGINEVEGLTIVCKTDKYAKVSRLIHDLIDRKLFLSDAIVTADLHAISIQIPIDMGAFIKGQYSQIYTPEQIEKCFNPTDAAYKVLKQDKSWFPKFFEQMKKNFEVKGSEHIPPNLHEDLFTNYTEYDIPPCLGQEVIFYKSN